MQQQYRADTHFQKQEFREAAALYQELIQLHPSEGELYLKLSSCLIHLSQLDEACVIAKNALLYVTTDHLKLSCQLQLGTIYHNQGRIDDAAQQFEQILKTYPSHLQATIGLANILSREGYPNRALKILSFLQGQEQHHELFAIAYTAALFESRKTNNALSFLLEYARTQKLSSTLNSNALNFCQYTFERSHYLTKIRALQKPHKVSDFHSSPFKKANQRLKVGFISGEFCMHPVGYFLHSFLEFLSRRGVIIFLYSNGRKHDPITQHLKNSASSFNSILGFSTEQALQKIRADILDILIDLSGHTAGNRLDIFENRAAPVQVTYLGYPDSTHTPNIDYMITDRFHVHAHEHDHYSEKIVYLPTTRFCFALPLRAPEISELPFFKNRYLTFGCFSNVVKLSEPCLILWAQVLQVIPDSRLKLRHQSLVESEQKKEILSFFTCRGIAQGRIEFYPDCKYDSYLEAYSEVDVMLDTQPFSGATTTCEALWMGVPILTIEGDFPAARQTASILNAINATEWIAKNAEDFVKIARSLTENNLQEFRKTSRQKILASPLGNPRLFAEQFDNVLNTLEPLAKFRI